MKLPYMLQLGPVIFDYEKQNLAHKTSKLSLGFSVTLTEKQWYEQGTVKMFRKGERY